MTRVDRWQRRAHAMYRRIVSIFTVVAILSGCVPYPVLKTLQPAATVSLVDIQGKPVPAASVTLISSAYPYGLEKSRETKLTAINGTVAFDPTREFRVEVLAMHGSEEFFWNWCIQKDGFETVETSHRGASEFESRFAVVLAAGVSTPCREGLRLRSPTSKSSGSALTPAGQ
jgi:hypothetical protein